MKHLFLAALAAMLASPASSQLVIKPGLGNSPLQCQAGFCSLSCKAQPGTVDQCTRYWTFKNTNAGVKQIENTDPNACHAAVEDNLKALGKFYGARPEIGLPTKEMADVVGTLKVPDPGPLPDSRKLDTAPKTNGSMKLDAQIGVERDRISALAEDAQVYAGAAATTVAWEAAALASQRLVQRALGAEKALSLASPWPNLAEFAPKTWGMRVCDRTKKPLMEQLEKRMRTETDIAWSFAFFDDWLSFRKPFLSSPGTPTADNMKSAFDELARPFFVEFVDRVSERSDKTLFTLADVRAFRDAVGKTGAVIGPYASDRKARLTVRRTELLLSFDQEKTAVAQTQAAVDVRQEALSAAKTTVSSAVAQRAAMVDTIGGSNASIATATKDIADMSLKRDKLKESSDEAKAVVKTRADRVAEAQVALESIPLNCGGLPYESCKNEAAKLEYDKLRYKAQQVVAAARSAYLLAVDKSLQLADEVLAAEDAVFAKRTALAGFKSELAKLIKSREELDVLLVTLKSNADTLQAELGPLIASMTALKEAASKLEALRP